MNENMKVRFRFQKTGSAAFISHLDLMRTLGRALSRAEIPAAKTNGFNPHAYISIPCALSLGYEGRFEMADIGLDATYPVETIPEKLNAVLPDGIRVTEAYRVTANPRDIAMAEYTLRFTADRDYGEICDILKQKPLVVMKKSKRSEEEKDISGLIAQVEPIESGIRALLCSSTSESLNPRLLMAALEKYAPDLKLGPVTIARGRFYTSDGKEFK